MRVDVSFKYLEETGFINNILEKNFKRIERRIKIFRRDDPIHISVHLEKNPHREHYSCRTYIYLPSKVIKATRMGNNSTSTINKTFSALSKQLDRLKHRLEKHLRKNKKY
jgi:ribosomal subunit interface protein